MCYHGRDIEAYKRMGQDLPKKQIGDKPLDQINPSFTLRHVILSFLTENRVSSEVETLCFRARIFIFPVANFLFGHSLL